MGRVAPFKICSWAYNTTDVNVIANHATQRGTLIDTPGCECDCSRQPTIKNPAVKATNICICSNGCTWIEVYTQLLPEVASSIT